MMLTQQQKSRVLAGLGQSPVPPAIGGAIIVGIAIAGLGAWAVWMMTKDRPSLFS